MDYLMLIDGELVAGPASFDVINPATERPFARAPKADAALLDAAVEAGRRAFHSWSKMPIAERGATLHAVAVALEDRAEEFARLLVAEQGKPLAEAQFEVGGSIACLHAFADMRLDDEVVRDGADTKIVAQRYPLGVVAAITPWNFPMLLLMMKVAPALVAGNTVVAKPAATTPLTTLLFGELCAPILPAGVLNIIIDENDLGERLTAHPGVAKVSFTGSSATGRKVMASAAGTLKRLTLEMGGNDAALVLADADVQTVAPGIFGAAMLNAGQVCLAAKRVYAPTQLYDALCDELARLAREAIVDDGLQQGARVGPLQNRQQYEKVKGFLEDATANGTVIAGGAPLERDGFFIAPTIVRDIPESARLVREEQFGPILPVLAYDDLDDAILRVNDSEFGLGATVWTSDPALGMEVASRIESGTVWINKHLVLPFDVPFGGAKSSGMGAELGREGLEEFTQLRIVNAAL